MHVRAGTAFILTRKLRQKHESGAVTLTWPRGRDSAGVRLRSFPRNSDEAKPRRAVWTGGVLGLGPAVPYRSLVGENDEPGDGRDLSRRPELR
jgi:hypothetical protein